MITAQLVREARRGGGLSQRALAARAGVHQPALADIERSAHDTRGEQLERLVNAAGYRLVILPTSARTAADWGDLIYQELRGPRGSEEVAFRALIGLSDDLTAASMPLRIALCVTPPAPCGDPRFDAAIAAVVDHHLARDRLPVPEWVHEPSRVLDEPWLVSPYTGLESVPQTFRRHGVLLAASELGSV
ncbi:MAG: helix-turn-helix domain-containing protein [Acidimicrobiales bacterium]